jgi:hypothetical protein
VQHGRSTGRAPEPDSCFRTLKRHSAEPSSQAQEGDQREDA